MSYERLIQKGKLGGSTATWKLPYLRDHAMNLTVRQLHEVTGCSETFIYAYFQQEGIEYKTVHKKGHVHEPRKRIIYSAPLPRQDAKSKEFVRPAAVYDNKSREQRIDELLNS